MLATTRPLGRAADARRHASKQHDQFQPVLKQRMQACLSQDRTEASVISVQFEPELGQEEAPPAAELVYEIGPDFEKIRAALSLCKRITRAVNRV